MMTAPKKTKCIEHFYGSLPILIKSKQPNYGTILSVSSGWKAHSESVLGSLCIMMGNTEPFHDGPGG